MTHEGYTAPHNRLPTWLMALSFTGVLWSVCYLFSGITSPLCSRSVRLSIFLSLVRVSNPTGTLKHVALACIACMLLMFGAAMAQKIYYCAAYKCFISVNIAVLQLTSKPPLLTPLHTVLVPTKSNTADVLADALLLLGPVPLLRNVHLTKTRRALILSAFWSSILVTIISITHSVLLLHGADYLTSVLGQMKVSPKSARRPPTLTAIHPLRLPPASHASPVIAHQAALSLFVCNLLVLVTFVYRLCRRHHKRGGLDLDAVCPNTGPLYLTTIDLSQITTDTITIPCTLAGTGSGGESHGLAHTGSASGQDSVGAHVHRDWDDESGMSALSTGCVSNAVSDSGSSAIPEKVRDVDEDAVDTASMRTRQAGVRVAAHVDAPAPRCR